MVRFFFCWVYFLASWPLLSFCCLLITFANSLDPDQDGQNVHPDLDPNCLTLWQCSWKYFWKSVFWKKSADGNKSMKNFPACTVIICLSNFRYGPVHKILVLSPNEQKSPITLYIQETPKWVLWQTVKTKMKCSIHQGLHCLHRQKWSSDNKNAILFENYNLTPLDMYNGLFQVYCVTGSRYIWINYRGMVECLPVDPANWIRFPAGTGKIFLLYDNCIKPEGRIH